MAKRKAMKKKAKKTKKVKKTPRRAKRYAGRVKKVKKTPRRAKRYAGHVKKAKKTRAVAKPAPKKMMRPAPAPSKKPVMAAAKQERKELVRKISKDVAERLIGKVVHYYDGLGVAIVELQKPLRIGDMVKVMHGDQEFLQRVSSLQIDHQNVAEAMPGSSVGVKVDREAKEGSMVMPAW